MIEAVHPGWAAVLALACGALGYVLGRRRGGEAADSDPARLRLRRAEDRAGIGQFDWNLDTNELWWSDRLYAMYGRTPADGITIEEGFGNLHPDDVARANGIVEALLAGKEPPFQELRIFQTDGSMRHAVVTAELYVENGQRHLFGLQQDITELVQARERLRAAEAEYRFLFEHSPLPMWVFDCETRRFLAVNDAMLEHYGYTRDELVGQSLEAIRPPEEVPAMLEALKRETRENAGLVWTHLRRDGTTMRMALYAHDIEFEGRRARLVTGQDVTEREASEERFVLLTRATSDAVYDYDPRTGTLWWSESYYTLFGYTHGELPATIDNWEKLLHPDHAERVIASLQRAFDDGSVEWTEEYPFRHASGHYVRVLDRGLLSRDASGNVVRMLGGMLDVTDIRRSEADLRLLRRAVESTDNGILIADARLDDLPLVYVNPAFEKLTGYPAHEVIGRNCRFLQGNDREQPGVAAIRGALAEQREVRVLLRNYRRDGSLFWNEVYIAPVRSEAGRLTHFVGVLSDASERQHYEAQLAHRATHDELTGLPNRVLLDDRLQQAMFVAMHGGDPAAVVFIDLDDFKLVNDSLGHRAGDVALREVSQRLQALVRDTDTVGRFGGDEFVIVLAHADAERVAETVRDIAAALATPIEVGETSHALTASIGYCLYPEDGEDPETLLMHADLAMYQAKRRGRNRAVAYRAEFDASVSQRLQLITQLREALEREEFVLAFQPLFAPDGRPLAMEALVRWQHPTRGLLMPAEFIGVCEESGLIVELGRRVLREAARHHALLSAQGLGDMRLAVNVSAAQFTDELYADVEAAMRDFGLPAGILELELTESVIMESPARAIELMDRIATLGVSFSVDDFGTGYSSLAYLKRFPIERLKIDRSFVQDLGVDADDAAICQSIIGLAHSLQICTVAEGVETEQQHAWLRERGCDELQGYLLGRPQSFDTLLPRLREALQSSVR